MAKNKLKKWAEMKTFSHVVQAGGKDWRLTDHALKGNWAAGHFKNDHPVILELGCGKGEYTVGLAEKFPDQNFIGVDIKGARIWDGAKKSHESGMHNVAFLRTRIDFIYSFFGENEVDEIWLTFSDPQPEKERKRLTAPLFIDRYRKFLKPGGIIHLKTDSELLYQYTLDQVMEHKYELLYSTHDLYATEMQDTFMQSILHIRTHYEQIWLNRGLRIRYLKFRL